MQKLRIIPWLIGIALILTTLAGANRLLHSDPASSGGGGAPPKPPTAPAASEGLVAKGTVRSDPPDIRYTLPSHLSAASVAQVFVQSGQDVKENDPLVRFDDRLLRLDLKEAEMMYQMAVKDYQKALAEQAALEELKAKAAQAIQHAKHNRDRANEKVTLVRKNLEEELAIQVNKNDQKLTAEEKEQRLVKDPRLHDAQSLADVAKQAVEDRESDLKFAEKNIDKLKPVIEDAAFHAELIKAKIAKANIAIEDCTFRAPVAGKVEQVTASKGQTVYPQTQPPLLYLVPTGKRVVWAEVVPEFAHKIKDREGQKVTISDDSNTHLTYEGVVKRISESILPKPNGAPDVLNGKSNAVLIVEIEVIDATPAGKPPLRVGQPVRVSFPAEKR
jgi:multidrug resistance efflux pump